MKKIFLLAMVCVFTFQAEAQIISNQVLSVSGDHFTSANHSISWTLGETMVNSWFGANNIMTEGFQQTNIFISKINEKQPSKISVSVYPNPSADIINIHFSETNNHTFVIKLFDLSGRQIIHEKKIVQANQSNISLNLSAYASGQYLMVVMDLSNQQQQTFSVQKIK